MKALLPLLPAIVIFPIGCMFAEKHTVKLLWATLGLLFLLKLGALIRNHQQSLALPKGFGWFAYLFMWPGMRPESFSCQNIQEGSVAREFVSGFLIFVAGLLAQLALAVTWSAIQPDLRLYLGVFSFLLLIHFGLSSFVFTFHRLCGWPVEPLFSQPFQSTSLREFWGQRWNLAFVDMDKRLILPLFPKRLAKTFAFLAVFLVSGVLHEVGISYPAGGGWGLPLLYFLVHGILTILEPSLPLVSKSKLLKPLWVWGALLVPLPLLFHRTFVVTFIQPYFEFLSVQLNTISLKEFLYWAILTCGVGHLLILVASFQVPQKLGWKKEFAKLGRFNQKIFWTYGSYIVFCIIAFALVDLLNAKGLLDHHPSSLAIAGFIALFWTARVIVDFGYFKHDDWPKGDIFVIGHTCLTALFTCLALVHWGVVVCLSQS